MKEVLKEKLRRSLWLEIDLDQLESNYLALKEMVGSVKVMPAVKANGYGHGIVQCSQVLAECGADYLGVGSADEAILLRENGVRTPILVFESSFIPDMAGVFKEYDLMPTVFNMEQAQALSAVTDKEMKIFVKIDTGRGRLGINAEEFPDFYKKLKELQNLKVEGVYSHMCGAEWPDENCPSRSEYPLWQYRRFCKAMEGIGEERKNIPFRQLANTPACIAYPEIRMTGICPGRAIWGYSPLERREGHPDLAMPMKALKSRLLDIHEVTGGKFGPGFSAVKLDHPRRIGVIAGGVGDGISPKHAASGHVLIRGKKIPIASAICLEHMIVDLTECPEAKMGDEVVLFGSQGNENIPISALLKAWDKTLVEFWTSFSTHISRVYLRRGELYSITSGDIPKRIDL